MPDVCLSSCSVLLVFHLSRCSHSKCSSRAPASLLLTHRKPLQFAKEQHTTKGVLLLEADKASASGCTAPECWKCSILEENLMVVLEHLAKGLLCTNSAPLQFAQQGGKVRPLLWHTRCDILGDQRLQGIFPGALEMVHLQAWEQGEVPQCHSATGMCLAFKVLQGLNFSQITVPRNPNLVLRCSFLHIYCC